MEKTKNLNEKLTYEQLQDACHQLSEQSRSLYAKLQEANLFNVYRNLDYLFKVVENPEVFASNMEFYNKCRDQIIKIMEFKEETPEEENKEE